MKKLYIFASLLLLTIAAAAQKDYYITTKNDTIYGIISNAPFSGYKYKASEDDKGERLDKTTTEVYLSKRNEHYVSRVIPGAGKPTFLLRVEQGSLELYQFYRVTYGAYGATSTTVIWYASKEGRPLITLKHNSWLTFSKEKRKDEFYELIKDNEEVAEKFLAEDKFSFETIRQLVSMYNFDAKKAKKS